MPYATVRALASHGKGEPLLPFSYDLEEGPRKGEVDVEVACCGVCHSDVHQIDDAWGVATFPLVPGHEVVGRVVATGGGGLLDEGEEGKDKKRLKVGQRVAIGVQRSCCWECSLCGEGRENVCPSITKTYAGKTGEKGGFATRIRFPEEWVFEVPPSLGDAEAAPLMCAGITVYSPLRRHLKEGSRVGVVGIGGLGHLALQFARGMVGEEGEVVAVSSTDSKREEALRFGANRFLSLESLECRPEDKAGMDLDVLLYTGSSSPPLDSLLPLLRPGGSLVLVGLPPSDQESVLPVHRLVTAEKAVLGSYLGPRSDYASMLEFAAEKGIRPAVEVVPFSRAQEGVDRVRKGKARYRVVLSM